MRRGRAPAVGREQGADRGPLRLRVLEHDRAKNLFDKGALPRQRLDAAETAHRAAVAQRDLATANLAQSNAALRRSREVQSKLIVAVVGLIGAFTLAWYSFEGHWATFVAAVGSTAVALVWGLRYLQLTAQPDPPSQN